MSTSFGVMLLGTGSSLPARSLRNGDFPASLDTSDEWIRSRTGIGERRIAAAGDTSASLGLAAARRALEAAQLDPADLDMIICATVTPDMMVPAAACLIQSGLGCRPIPAFDINAACTGFLYGLSIAASSSAPAHAAAFSWSAPRRSAELSILAIGQRAYCSATA